MRWVFVSEAGISSAKSGGDCYQRVVMSTNFRRLGAPAKKSHKKQLFYKV